MPGADVTPRPLRRLARSVEDRQVDPSGVHKVAVRGSDVDLGVSFQCGAGSHWCPLWNSARVAGAQILIHSVREVIAICSVMAAR